MYLFLVLKSDMYAQQTIDFSFEKTGPNHSVLVLPTWHPVIKELELRDSLPKDFVLGFQNDSLETGDLVGIFFVDNNNSLKCASSQLWRSNDFNMFPVWGQYPSGADNGMEMGERMEWVAQKKDNQIYRIEVTYQKPLMAIYMKYGASAVLGMKLIEDKTLTPFKPFNE